MRAQKHKKEEQVMREDGGYAIADKVPLGKTLLYSLQHLMAFVGGGAIVPAMIMGLDPALAVFAPASAPSST